MKAVSRRNAFLASLLALLVWTAALFADPVFPALTGRVVDQAGLLSSAQEQTLTASLEAHEQRTTNQVVVVTLKSLEGYEFADYGYRLGRHWGIGQKGKDNGVLLIVAPKEHEVRIEVGYGLEGTLTDKIAHDIVQEVMLPRFKQGDYFGGIRSGTEAVLGLLEGETFSPSNVQRHERPGWPIAVLAGLGMLATIGSIVEMTLWNRQIFGILMGLIAGTVIWFGMQEFYTALIVGIVGYLIIVFRIFKMDNTLGNSSHSYGYYGHSYSNDTISSDSGGGWSSGGFSGGGGSFGGGGASGSW